MRIILFIVMFALYFYLGYNYAMMHVIDTVEEVEKIEEVQEIEEQEYKYIGDPNLDFYYDRDNK